MLFRQLFSRLLHWQPTGQKARKCLNHLFPQNPKRILSGNCIHLSMFLVFTCFYRESFLGQQLEIKPPLFLACFSAKVANQQAAIQIKQSHFSVFHHFLLFLLHNLQHTQRITASTLYTLQSHSLVSLRTMN